MSITAHTSSTLSVRPMPNHPGLRRQPRDTRRIEPEVSVELKTNTFNERSPKNIPASRIHHPRQEIGFSFCSLSLVSWDQRHGSPFAIHHRLVCMRSVIKHSYGFSHPPQNRRAVRRGKNLDERRRREVKRATGNLLFSTRTVVYTCDRVPFNQAIPTTPLSPPPRPTSSTPTPRSSTKFTEK